MVILLKIKKPKMKQSNYLILKMALSILFFALLVNCSTDPISCLTGSWAEELSSDSEAWVEAYSVYTESPTVENCNRYKSALGNYVNALEGVEDCYGGLADFDNDFSEARNELGEIDCTESTE